MYTLEKQQQSDSFITDYKNGWKGKSADSIPAVSECCGPPWKGMACLSPSGKLAPMTPLSDNTSYLWKSAERVKKQTEK